MRKARRRGSIALMSRLAFALLLTVLPASVPAASVTTWESRTAFEAILGTKVTDSYSTPGYDRNRNPGSLDILSNADMSAVLGESVYESTGFADWNIVFNQATDSMYCAGCNGSFRLSFGTTSVTGSEGVFGVGFDFANGSPNLLYHAFITFGDGTTLDVSLPFALGTAWGFFGVSSAEEIVSIHLGLAEGGSTMAGSFVIDDLTIGTSAVSAPGALGLLLLGFAALGLRRKP